MSFGSMLMATRGETCGVKGLRWSLSDDMSLAHHLADEATATALAWFGRPLVERTKRDGTLVTEADEAVEDQIRAILATERPNDAVLGEERGQTGTSDRRWIIDGIDGTVEFAAGTSRWGILIALEIEGEIVLGICAQPALARRYYATRTKGAFCRVDRTSRPPQRLSVSRSSDLATAASFVPAREIRNDADRHVAELLA